MIRPYLRDIINDCKIHGEWKVYLGNEVIDYKTQGEWKILLKMVINFISSKDSDEIHTMHEKNNNIEIIMVMKQMKLLKNFLNLFRKNIKKEQKKN